jgi:hypothetical protein
MKLGLPLLLAAGCVMSARVAFAEMTVKPGQPPALKDFPLSLTISNLPTFSLLPDGTNLPACPLIGTGLNLTPPHGTNAFRFRPDAKLATNDSNQIKPGIYLAHPFAMMVRVPGPLDSHDRMNEGLGNSRGTLDQPVIPPEVRLEPRVGSSK